MSILKGVISNGYWVEFNNDGRCILRCDDGYEPSGCHVIRYSHSEGKYNHDVPSCQKSKDITESTPPPQQSTHTHTQTETNQKQKQKSKQTTTHQSISIYIIIILLHVYSLIKYSHFSSKYHILLHKIVETYD